MRCFVVLAIVLATVGCSDGAQPGDGPEVGIDRTQPFRLEFGRGSGWHGLDTVKVDQTGRVVLHRMASDGLVEAVRWESATIQLTPEMLAEVLRAVESNALMGLRPAYHDPNVADGTQWVLWIRQGERDKSVYFNNSLPEPIIRFAVQLDAILSQAGRATAAWQPVPEDEARQHEKALWESVER